MAENVKKVTEDLTLEESLERQLAVAQDAIARLQERVEEAERRYADLLHTHDDVTLPLLYEADAARDRYKAQAERRKEALRRVRHSLSPNELAVTAIKSEDPKDSHFTPAARMTRNLTYEVIIALDTAIEEEAEAKEGKTSDG